MKKLILAVLFTPLFFIGCKDNEPEPPIDNPYGIKGSQFNHIIDQQDTSLYKYIFDGKNTSYIVMQYDGNSAGTLPYTIEKGTYTLHYPKITFNAKRESLEFNYDCTFIDSNHFYVVDDTNDTIIYTRG